MAKKSVKLSKKKQKPSKALFRLYDQEHTNRSNQYGKWATSLAAGKLSRAKFKNLMQADLKKYYIRIALLGKGGRKLTGRDNKDLSKFLTQAYQYLDGFIGDLKSYKAALSDAQVNARSRSYANSWSVFTRFNIPAVIADMLPALPGVDCLGGANCGCWLEWSASGTHVEVRWFESLGKEHCINCDAFAADWQPLELELPDQQDMDEEDWQDLQDW